MTKELKEFIEELISCNDKDYRNIDMWEERDDYLGTEFYVKGHITVYYTDQDLNCLTADELKKFTSLKYYYSDAEIDNITFEEIEHQFEKIENMKEVA